MTVAVVCSHEAIMSVVCLPMNTNTVRSAD